MSDTTKEALLGRTQPVFYKRRSVLLSAAALAVAGAVAFYMLNGTQKELSFVTTPLTRGAVQVSVTANGTLKPVRTVSIGSELSGIVNEVRVDVNSQVHAGDILIELDKTKLVSAVNQAKASLSSARAQLAQAQATVVEANAKMKRLEQLNRTSGGRLPSRTELDEQQATVLKADAGVLSARAAIEDAQATLQTKQTDLSKASIKAPVDGVVLARSVEPGYAVAASLQAVELLTVATDLRELELEVDVDEADVGQVRDGQKASFTVASYPNREFPATLTKVAYGSSTASDNVVTYTTYLSVSNKAMDLRPGMTATATIETAHKDGVLLVPNTALRFRPQVKAQSSGISSMMMARRPMSDNAKTAKEVSVGQAERQRDIYILKNGQAQRVSIVTGLTDGRMTEIVSGPVKVDDKVITDQLKAK